MQTTRIVVVDDDANLRRLIAELLISEPGLEVVAEAGDGREALLKARELRPDLVVMDIRMPGMNGLEATRRLKQEMPGIKVLILTMFDLQEYREVAMASGAHGYVIKKSLVEELLSAIRTILAANPVQTQ